MLQRLVPYRIYYLPYTMLVKFNLTIRTWCGIPLLTTIIDTSNVNCCSLEIGLALANCCYFCMSRTVTLLMLRTYKEWLIGVLIVTTSNYPPALDNDSAVTLVRGRLVRQLDSTIKPSPITPRIILLWLSFSTPNQKYVDSKFLCEVYYFALGSSIADLDHPVNLPLLQ